MMPALSSVFLPENRPASVTCADCAYYDRTHERWDNQGKLCSSCLHIPVFASRSSNSVKVENTDLMTTYANNVADFCQAFRPKLGGP